eukprot:Colp12_sorted_trinity150504_noHs@30668
MRGTRYVSSKHEPRTEPQCQMPDTEKCHSPKAYVTNCLCTSVGNVLGVEVVTLPDGLVLLGQREFGVVTILAGNGHVHFRALGCDDLSSEGLLRQVNLNAIGLINGHSGAVADNLDLNALAVDDLNTRDNVLEDDADLLAAVEDNVVNLLGVNLNSAVCALVDVDSLVHVTLSDDKIAVVLLPFNKPLLATLEFELGGTLLNASCGSRGSLSRCLFLGLNHGRSTELRVLVSHLRLVDLLQASSDTLSLVKSSENVRHGVARRLRGRSSTTGECLDLSLGHDRGARGRRRGAASLGSSRGRCSSGNGLSINTLGVPCNTSCVELLDVRSELLESGHPGTGPVDVLLVSVLEVLDDTVDVELGSVGHFLGERARLGGHGDPAKNGDALSESSEVVGLLSAAVLLTELANGSKLISSGLDEGREVSISGLLGLRGKNQESTLSLEGLLDNGRLSLNIITNLVSKLEEVLEVTSKNFVEGLNERSSRCVISRGSGSSGRSTSSGRANATANNCLLKACSDALEACNKGSKISHFDLTHW